ncbi:MAG: hypothetical protein MI867_11240, partial [Pseudomonadales bacterium]|nr:hypothetical protein [Pseudomonadales bacterium]
MISRSAESKIRWRRASILIARWSMPTTFDPIDSPNSGHLAISALRGARDTHISLVYNIVVTYNIVIVNILPETAMSQAALKPT